MQRPCQGRFWQVPGVERRPVGPKVGIEGGVLILGNDSGQVGRSQITQDLTGLREGSGLYLGGIWGRLICILGRWMAVAALCPAAWRGLEWKQDTADIKLWVDCGVHRVSQSLKSLPCGWAVKKLQRPREAAAVPAVASRLPCNNLTNGLLAFERLLCTRHYAKPFSLNPH